MSASTTPPPGAGGSQLTPELVDQLMKLSPDDRVELGNILLDSVEYPGMGPDEIKQAWRDESARRIEAVRNGTMKTYTLEETMEYLQKVVDEGRQP